MEEGKKKTVTLKSFTNIKEAIGKSVNDYVVEFGHEMGLGVEAIRRAGKVYATAIIRHPSTAMAKFAETYPTISAQTWDMLERIGNGDLNPNAMLLPNNVATRIAHIPIEKQNRIFATASAGFTVVNATTLKTRVVPISSLSMSQASILIDEEKGRIRTVEEQKKLLEDRPTTPRSSAKGKPPKYRILGNVCYINGVEIGLSTLKNIIREIEGSNPA